MGRGRQQPCARPVDLLAMDWNEVWGLRELVNDGFEGRSIGEEAITKLREKPPDASAACPGFDDEDRQFSFECLPRSPKDQFIKALGIHLDEGELTDGE